MARGRKKKQPRFNGELSPEQQKTKQERISDAVTHVAQQLEVIQSAQKSISYRAKLIQDDYGFASKTVKKLGQMKFKHSKDKLVEETEELVAEYSIYVEKQVKEEDEAE